MERTKKFSEESEGDRLRRERYTKEELEEIDRRADDFVAALNKGVENKGNFIKENIGNWLRIGSIVFLIIIGLIVLNTNTYSETKIGAIVMLIILGFCFLDDSARGYIRGDILSGEEEAKRKNPFIK